MNTVFNVINLLWEGPCTLDQVINNKNSDDLDYGIYTIYGTHSVLGPNTLLYIGQASSATFAGRISGHLEEWIEYEPTEPTFYLARISGIQQDLSDEEWGKYIDDAEKILIYDCTPPYNSKGLKNYTLTPGAPVQDKTRLIDDVPSKDQVKQSPHVLVINLGPRNRIPLYCSSFFSSIDALPRVYKRSEQ